MATIKRFEDLEVWQLSRQLVKQFSVLTLAPSFSQDRIMIYQMRRAAVSIEANIAEGFERGNNKEFIHYNYIAKGSAGEFRALLYSALDLNLINKEQFDELYKLVIHISRSLNGLIQYLKNTELKGSKFSEPEIEYNTNPSYQFEYQIELDQ